MKLNYPKEWFEERIEKEGDVNIGVGTLPPAERIVTPAVEPKVPRPRAASNPVPHAKKAASAKAAPAVKKPAKR